MASFEHYLIGATNLCLASINRISRVLTAVDVGEISTEQLRDLQRQDTANDHPTANFVLVDVRSESETSISMIPGAVTRTRFEEESSSYRERLVIPYCTVGGRSYVYARKLLKSGFEVRNYRESILGWCAASLPLMAPDGRPTHRVHVYHSLFTVPPKYEAVT